ncbi:MAG: bifunctional UDP-sugar hydrolase/5'-nucleotidase [Saprospiraceae bacterium]
MKNLNLNQINFYKKIFYLIFCLSIFSFSSIYSQTQGKRLTIIHTNDLQSRLLGFAPNSDFTPLTTNDDKTVGGIARVANVIRNQRAKAPDRTLVLDGGDWMMGTLFQTISTFEGAELRLMQAIGYDAAVIGNHEFDFHCDGLADIIESAMKHGEIPKLVLSNGNFSAEKKEDDRLEALFKKGKILSHFIMEKNGIRIGMFGLLGKEAASVAPYSKPMTFDDPIESAKKMTTFLKDEEKVDVIICMTHSGVWHVEDGSWGGEDVDLAKAVPAIDVVISGHSHTPLPEPIMVNGTPVVQAGSEGEYVGVLEMQYQDGQIQMTDYQLVKVDDSFATEADINSMVDSFQLTIDDKILEKYDVKFTDVLAETDFDLTISRKSLVASNLGAFAADAVRFGVEKFSGNPEIPVVGFTTAGLIRDNLLAGEKGMQQVSDLYRIMPLGRGVLDEDPGYPLAKGFITPVELKSVLEILLIAPSLKGNSHFPFFSGMRFKYNPNRMLLDQVYEVEIGNEKDGYTVLDISSDEGLIAIGANSYIYESINLIGEISKGLLSVVPKNADGIPIENIKDALLDFSKTEPGIQEVKEWSSLFELTKSFPDVNGNGFPDFPEFYKKGEVRQIEMASWNPVMMYRNATKVMWGTTGIFLLVGWFFIWLIRRFRKKRREV